MKLQRTTWILLATALTLGSFVYLAEFTGSSRREAAELGEQKLFELSEEQIEGVEIARPEQKLRFERTGKAQQPWQMKQPENVPASEPQIVFLLNLIVEGKSDRAFKVARSRLSEYGLDQPTAEIAIGVKGKEQPHTLLLGKPNFDEKFLYARVDPPDKAEKEVEVVLVPIDFRYAVERDLEDWKEDKEKDSEDNPNPDPD
ncbi:MAG: DUF4340 domain-containing protein [Cyanobacteriota bacterium]|nr:DUF4340 domain-containing protein [Cyanobacteriota bacterium]